MKFDHETDILVVGTGAAAFSAAITAKKNGSQVKMIEKSPLAGGTTLRSGGGFWIPNNRFQKKKASWIKKRMRCATKADTLGDFAVKKIMRC